MKVLLVADFYPPRTGGLEAHVARLAQHLAAAGHEVNVATTGRPGHLRTDGATQVWELGLTVASLPGAYQSDRAFHPPWADRAFTGGLRRVVEQVQPDVIHAHGWSVFSAAKVGRAKDVPVVATLHDYGLICPTKALSCAGKRCKPGLGLCCLRCTGCDQGLLKRGILALALRAGRRALNRDVSRFLAVSSFVAEQHRLAGIGTQDHLMVVPNFVDLTDDAPTSPPDDGGILFIGPSAPYKGQQLLLQAHEQLGAHRAPLHLVGSESRPLPGDIHWHGRLDGTALWSAYRSSRIVAVPSLCPDSCPTVALEAMALGRPVVATAVGGLTDIVAHGVTGLLVEPDSPDALATALQTLLDQPERARAMGSAARQRAAEMFSAQAVVPMVEAVYQEVRR